MAKRTSGEVVAWIAAGILIAAGVITIAVGLTSSVSFGWTAFAPISDETFTVDSGVFMPHVAITGFVLCSVGLIALAFLAGWAFGGRRSSTS